MDKISGIIPSSRRVTAVDMSDAAPIRPGVPAFGRPTGVSAESLSKSTISQSATTNFDIGLKNHKEVAQSALVEDMSKAFFMHKENPKNKISNTEIPETAEAAWPSIDETPEYVRTGRYIDVTV